MPIYTVCVKYFDFLTRDNFLIQNNTKTQICIIYKLNFIIQLDFYLLCTIIKPSTFVVCMKIIANHQIFYRSCVYEKNSLFNNYHHSIGHEP